jgi:hypothetical protein
LQVANELKVEAERLVKAAAVALIAAAISGKTADTEAAEEAGRLAV